MPIDLPNLDDRRYKDLVEEARSLIPTYAPQWTNHNPSDPGITLIEMFAYHTEMLIYRLNRITDANKGMFLKLLKGENWKETTFDSTGKIIEPGDDLLAGDALMQEIRKTVLEFRNVDRAVTVADFENLAIAADQNVARVRCVPRRNLTSANLLEISKQNPGHVSVIIIPRPVFDEVGVQTAIFSDVTKEAGFGSNTGIKLLADNSGYLYVGMAIQFGEIQFLFSESGSNYQLKLEYYNGANWFELTQTGNSLVDYTIGWSINGTVQFTIPHDWITVEAGKSGVKRYWVRFSTTTIPTAIAKAVRIFPKILQPDTNLLVSVRNNLDDRRLLTTVVHVVGPSYLRLNVCISIVLMPDALKSNVLNYCIEALWKYFNPLTGGREGNGWPFGRAVYVSEIYALLDKLPGVDYVCKSKDIKNTELDEIVVESAIDNRYQRNSSGELESVKLYENELIDITFPAGALTILTQEESQKGAD